MAENDSSKIDPENPDPNTRQEIGQFTEPHFQMGSFKLLSEEELKALDDAKKAEAAASQETQQPEAELAALVPSEIAEPEQEPVTPPPAPDEPEAPSYFGSGDVSVHPLRLRAGNLIQPGNQPKPEQPKPLAPKSVPAPPKVTKPEPVKPVQQDMKEVKPAPKVREEPTNLDSPIEQSKPGLLSNPLVRIVLFFLLILIVAIVLQLPTIPAAGYFSHHLRQKSDLGFADEMLAALAALWVMVHFNEHLKLSDIGFTKNKLAPQFTTGAAIGSVCVGVPFVATLVTFYYSPGEINQNAALLAPMAVCLMIAVTEETIYRGYVLRLVENSLGSMAGILISCTLFTVLHYMTASTLSIPDYQKYCGPLLMGFGEGLALAAAYVASRNLWMPIGLHFAALFLMGPLLGFNSAYAADSGNSLFHGSFSGDFWLSGGILGPESSLPAAISFLIAGILLIRKAMRTGTWKTVRRTKVVL